MSLINCPECGSQVSSLAAACPKCAAPIADLASARATGKPVTTTQLTSKRFKGLQAIGAGLILIGLLMLIAGGGCSGVGYGNGIGIGFTSLIGVALMVIGLVLVITGKASAWWHHG